MSISKFVLAAVVAIGAVTASVPADAHWWNHHRVVAVHRVVPVVVHRPWVWHNWFGVHRHVVHRGWHHNF